MHIHPDITEREKLLCSLFNMKKKPNKKERILIIGGNHKHIPTILYSYYRVYSFCYLLSLFRLILVLKIF